MLGDELRHLLDALFALEEVLQVHRPFEDLVQLLDVGHALGFARALLNSVRVAASNKPE